MEFSKHGNWIPFGLLLKPEEYAPALFLMLSNCKCVNPWSWTRARPMYVLVLSEIELIFSLVADAAPCFGVSVRIMLITC